MRVTNALQPTGTMGQCLFPACLAEMRPRISRIDSDIRRLWRICAADQRFGEPMRMGHVIETKAAFHTQPVVVRGTVATIHKENFVVLDLVSDLAADAAVRADA